MPLASPSLAPAAVKTTRRPDGSLILEPGLVYASDGGRYARALAAIGGTAEVVVSRGAQGSALPFEALLDREPGPAVDERFAAQGPDSIAKILFTSGSTGQPKGVVNTQRMLCSNQAAIAEVWPFLRERPPVVLDWLPWSHTFGADHNFNLVLFHGGSLFLDDGKPTPEHVERTVANLRDALLSYLARRRAGRSSTTPESSGPASSSSMM